MDQVVDLIQARAMAAAYHAQGNLGTLLDYEDFQDVVQSAAEGFWRAWKRKPGQIGYAVVAARNAATKFMIRQLWGNNPFNTSIIIDEGDCTPFLAAQEEKHDLPEEILRELYNLFLKSRNKKGQRGALAAARDGFVVNALHKQWNNEAIANALNVSIDSVKKYRRRIQTVLEERSKLE